MSETKNDSLNKVGPKRVLKYIWQKYMTEKTNFFLLLLSRLGLTIFNLLPAFFFKDLIDLISGFTGTDKSGAFAIGVGLLVTIFWIKVLSNITYRFGDYLVINMSVNIDKKIYLECFEYVHGHSYRFFANNFTGSLIKKINKLVGAYDNLTDTITFEISPILLNMVFILVVIGIKDWRLSVIFLLWFAVFAGVQYFFYKRNYPWEIKANEKDSELSGILSDTITNNFNIKAFASIKREYDTFDKHLIDRSWIQKKRRNRALVIWGTTGLMMVSVEFIMFYMAIKFWSQDTITIGFFVLIQMYLVKLLDQMRNLGNIFRHLYKGFSESAEMLEILDEPHEVCDNSEKGLLVSQGRIEWNSVDFAYDKEQEKIFSQLSMSIKPGEKVAFVGQSGAGKTSIAKLLLRFYDIQGGAILIDGQNISEVSQESLRSNLSLVPQDPILFHRSLKENIAYGNPDASEEEIIAASKMARCHNFIEKLSSGYDTLVGERGIKLSGGERQRVAIARALLENRRILIMDEATSALDSESEHLIQEAMEAVMRNKTAIVIAHRLSTVMNMDRIIVMDQGKIVEQGSHKELLLKQGGVYKKLRDIQSGGFIE